jgi:hypothetical protein
VLRAALPPVFAAYAIFVAMVVRARRHPVPRPRTGSWWLGRRRAGLARSLAVTTLGGYLVFVGIVAVFHAWLAGEDGAIRSGVTEGFVLALVVFVLFTISGWSPRRRRPGPSPAMNPSK